MLSPCLPVSLSLPLCGSASVSVCLCLVLLYSVSILLTISLLPSQTLLPTSPTQQAAMEASISAAALEQQQRAVLKAQQLADAAAMVFLCTGGRGCARENAFSVLLERRVVKRLAFTAHCCTLMLTNAIMSPRACQLVMMALLSRAGGGSSARCGCEQG